MKVQFRFAAGAALLGLAQWALALNVPGPVVIPLLVPSATDFSVGGCTTVNDEALLDAIAANPKAYYVNVHNANNPGGEIRGQLK